MKFITNNIQWIAFGALIIAVFAVMQANKGVKVYNALKEKATYDELKNELAGENK